MAELALGGRQSHRRRSRDPKTVRCRLHLGGAVFAGRRFGRATRLYRPRSAAASVSRARRAPSMRLKELLRRTRLYGMDTGSADRILTIDAGSLIRASDLSFS